VYESFDRIPLFSKYVAISSRSSSMLSTVTILAVSVFSSEVTIGGATIVNVGTSTECQLLALSQWPCPDLVENRSVDLDLTP